MKISPILLPVPAILHGQSAAPSVTTPSIGAISKDSQSTTANSLTYTLSHATTTGDFLMFIACRSNANPTRTLSALGLSGTGTPTVLGTALLNGADRMLVGGGWVRGAQITTHTITFTMSDSQTRDFVTMAVDIVDMAPTGTPVIGYAPYTRGATGADVGGSYTPNSGDNRLIFFGGIGNGNALPLTPTNLTLADSASTGNGGDTFDHVAGLGHAVATDTAARDLLLTGDSDSTYAAGFACDLVAA